MASDQTAVATGVAKLCADTVASDSARPLLSEKKEQKSQSNHIFAYVTKFLVYFRVFHAVEVHKHTNYVELHYECRQVPGLPPFM